MYSLFFGIVLAPFVILGNVTYQVHFFDSAWQEQEPGDCLMVMGSQVLPGDVPGRMMKERIKVAQEVIHDDLKAIIVTGGTIDENISAESQVLKDLLVESGVESSKILTEESSTSTYENLLLSRELVEAAECSKLDVISHDFHLARVKLTAKRLGVELNRLIPASSSSQTKANYLMREHKAYLAYWLWWSEIIQN